MNRPIVKSSVEARLSDKSIKVREAVLGLVEAHSCSSISCFGILRNRSARLLDKGVSVRKQAVKISKHHDLSTETSETSRYVQVSFGSLR